MDEQNLASVEGDQAAPEVATIGKRKKLTKEITGTVVKITEGTTGIVMEFDCSELPEEIQAKLMPFGAGHKLGDAAAGKDGQEAVEAINKVWKGLIDNDWSVRAPAGEKISKSELAGKVGAIEDEEEREATLAALRKLGISL